MTCQKCNNPGVSNTAGGKDFWYCRTCKDEIMPPVAKALEPRKMSDDALDALNYLYGQSLGSAKAKPVPLVYGHPSFASPPQPPRPPRFRNFYSLFFQVPTRPGTYDFAQASAKFQQHFGQPGHTFMVSKDTALNTGLTDGFQLMGLFVLIVPSLSNNEIRVAGL